MTTPTRPEYERLELRVDPEPVRSIPLCPACGDLLFPGDYQDAVTGRCVDCVGRAGSLAGWIAVGVVVVLAALAIAAAGWALAPRSAPDPTGEPSAHSDRPTGGASDPSLVDLAASGPEPSPGPAAPAPTGAIGDPLVSSSASGWATYCAPTPDYCQTWGDGALLGAVPSFAWGDEPYPVVVCLEGGARCVTVTVVSYCACGDRDGIPTVIDLSPAAFEALAPLARGVIPVRVDRADGPELTLPPTDSE